MGQGEHQCSEKSGGKKKTALGFCEDETKGIKWGRTVFRQREKE